jgi:hypothetical protein
MEVEAIRVSDAERREVVEQLGHHYADGRLTLEELRERTVEAWSVRTDTELAVVLRELPAPTPAPDRVAPLRWRIHGLSVRAHAVVAAVGVTTAWGIEHTGSTPGDQWPLALGVAWAGALGAHAAGAWLRRQAAVPTSG